RPVDLDVPARPVGQPVEHGDLPDASPPALDRLHEGHPPRAVRRPLQGLPSPGSDVGSVVLRASRADKTNVPLRPVRHGLRVGRRSRRQDLVPNPAGRSAHTSTVNTFLTVFTVIRISRMSSKSFASRYEIPRFLFHRVPRLISSGIGVSTMDLHTRS